MQRAQASLHRIQRVHPEYREAAAEALRNYGNDPEIVSREAAISHQIASQAYADGTRQRMAAVEASVQRRYAEDGAALGLPTASLEASVPYALSHSTPRKDTLEGTGSHRTITRDRNKCTVPPEPRPSSAKRCYDSRPVPYDTARVAGTQYPSPPAVGVSVGIYQKPLGVRLASQQGCECQEDVDTLDMKRAQAARGPRQRSQPVQDFIFGQEPTPPRPPMTLRERTEARWRNEENERLHRATGRARAAHQNTHTPLW